MAHLSIAMGDYDDLDAFDDDIDFQIKKRVFRPRLYPLEEFSDEKIRERFRLSRVILVELFGMVEDTLRHPTDRNHAIRPLTQMLIAINYYATGDHYRTIGDVFGVHKSTVSRCVVRVTGAFLEHAHKFIRMPDPDGDEIDQIKNGFYQKCSLSGIIGAIDGTHVRIMRPRGTPDAPFINRKGYPSLNVFACCDDRRRIRSIQAKFPGCCHDSTILKSTEFFRMFENGDYNDSVILGDSGYGLRNWLFVPIRVPANAAQARFNGMHKTGRVVIEQTFGVSKSRFRVLHSEVRLEPGMVCKVIVVCSMLHNIAIDQGMEDYDPEDFNNEDDGDDNPPPPGRHIPTEATRRTAAKRRRDDYIQRVVQPQIRL